MTHPWPHRPAAGRIHGRLAAKERASVRAQVGVRTRRRTMVAIAGGALLWSLALGLGMVLRPLLAAQTELPGGVALAQEAGGEGHFVPPLVSVDELAHASCQDVLDDYAGTQLNVDTAHALTPDESIVWCGGHSVEEIRTTHLTYEVATPLPAALVAEEGDFLPGETLVVRRTLRFDGEAAVLATGAYSLHSAVFAADGFAQATELAAADDVQPHALHALLHRGKNRAVRRLGSNGLASDRHQIALTIDMCPSSRPIEASLFRWLQVIASMREQPTPIALAVTGGWIADHQEEFAVLRQTLARAGLLITWVNHSFSHARNPSRNGDLFLTHPKARLAREVLGLETALLQHGLVPSIYFRFPGLVYDAATLRDLNNLGLAALDADAWLGNAQDIYNGSVVLVHGNGNEGPSLRRLQGFFAEHWLELREQRLELTSLQQVGMSPQYTARVRHHRQTPARGEAWLEATAVADEAPIGRRQGGESASDASPRAVEHGQP